MVHRKRNHPGIVHRSTVLDGLIFWDVPQIAAYHKKLMDEVLQRLHNITRVKNNGLGLGENVEEEHIG